MKVYCKNCKFNRHGDLCGKPRRDRFNPFTSTHHEEYHSKEDHNRGGDCTDYKPNMFKRMVSWIIMEEPIS
jgi:hypothetical protein